MAAGGNGSRRNYTQEVAGSSPASSPTKGPPERTNDRERWGVAPSPFCDVVRVSTRGSSAYHRRIEGETRGLGIPGYRLDRLLARGGMGEVYLAEEIELGRKVALKLLARNLSEDERFRERFLRESRLAASLNHPNIVPVYRAGDADGVLFIAMHYVEGTDLRELMGENQGGLETVRAVSIVEQVADALDAAHGHQLVHRDVKPANVLIAGGRRGDHCYLADFGLTRHASSQSRLTATGEFLGTVDYVAPEQIRALAPVDQRVDVYSLGCVLFESLTGMPPFRGDSDYSVMWAHVHDPPPTISNRREDLPVELDAVIEHALAKSPADRYPTAGVLAEAARSALVQTGTRRAAPPVRARRPAPEIQSSETIRSDGGAHADGKRPRTAGVPPSAIVLAAVLGGLGLLVAIGFGAWALWPRHSAPATGTIAFKRTEDAYTTRADFYRRFAHHRATTRGRAGMGLVVLVQTSAQHAGACSLRWTALNVKEDQPVSDNRFVDQRAEDVVGASACNGEKRVWMPWPCVPSDSRLRYELDLYADATQLSSTTTKTFPTGGGC